MIIVIHFLEFFLQQRINNKKKFFYIFFKFNQLQTIESNLIFLPFEECHHGTLASLEPCLDVCLSLEKIVLGQDVYFKLGFIEVRKSYQKYCQERFCSCQYI